jgi:Fanconi anemia group M protein
VFFLTPQVIMNDLSRGTCPAVDVRCLVIDEAHKATGNHAYCQVGYDGPSYKREITD